MNKFNALVNEALTSGQAHEYYVNDKGNLTGFGLEVEIYNGEYIVQGATHTGCNGSHVSCREFERVTTDPREALENLVIVNQYEMEA